MTFIHSSIFFTLSPFLSFKSSLALSLINNILYSREYKLPSDSLYFYDLEHCYHKKVIVVSILRDDYL